MDAVTCSTRSLSTHFDGYYAESWNWDHPVSEVCLIFTNRFEECM